MFTSKKITLQPFGNKVMNCLIDYATQFRFYQTLKHLIKINKAKASKIKYGIVVLHISTTHKI